MIIKSIKDFTYCLALFYWLIITMLLDVTIILLFRRVRWSALHYIICRTFFLIFAFIYSRCFTFLKVVNNGDYLLNV